MHEGTFIKEIIGVMDLSILPSFVLVLPLAGLVSVENNASPHNKQIHIGSVAISIIDP